jgi:mannose/fructose/N-acetylgalactosamine-specific phosphotransferase system component IID
MKEKINWQKELLESKKFNDKFSKNLLEHGAKNFMQGIYLGYMYSRYRKIRDLYKDDPVENTRQIHHHSKNLKRK